MGFWRFLVNGFFLVVSCIILLLIVGYAVICLIDSVKRMLKNYREKKLKIKEGEETDIVDPVCL